ncbi:MAG: acyltransferase domain-containing protein, partial [Proteobacteria bacterium]|nr:acyltransferase domain-containing protein [Pseudomonadota bacterium]
SHAFHSKMMDPILVEFASHVNKVAINPPTIPCISNLTGTWINDQDLRAEYWADHLRNTVRFSDGIKNLAAENDYIFLEIGPGNVLSTLTKSHFNAAQMPPVLSAMRHPKDDTSDTAFILKTLGSLWLEGCTIDWNNFYKGEKRSRIPLPTYPFDRKRHWVDPTIPPQGFAAMRAGLITAGTHTQTCQEDSRQIIHEQRSSKPVAPGNDPEQGLVKIWQRVLGHGDIGIHDSFFDIGGNSLNGVRVFTHIYEDFGLRIPLATLFSAPTIELLARVIRQESFDRSWSSLVEIQASGTKPPFFCIHSEGGNIVEYYPLSKHCGTDQPFYGIQARGLSGEQIEGTSVREMARHYLEDIRKKQPSGPYFLGGFCLGGLIAFEMTRQLEAVGEKVAFLGMISTSTPAHVTGIKPGISWAQKNYYSWKERLDYEFSNLSVLGLQEKIRYIRDRFTRLSLHFRYYYESIAEDVSGAFNLGEYKHSRIYNLEQLGKVQHKAFRSYVPHPVIHTPITLIRPSRQPYVRNDDLNLGWEGLSAGGITTYEINCFHKNILKEPHAVQLADILRKCLDDADTR